METERGTFFIGQAADGAPVLYDSTDLTTHAVIVGMTGSGKTGLGITIIEEALLNGIPCLVIDPKGDMGNLLLNFPDLSSADFRPWIDEAEAERADVTPDELAAKTAATWKKGLADAGIEPERLGRLREGAEMTIYTPGSGAGVGLNVLGSMKSPSLDWDTQAELIHDEIESFVSSLLTLAGIEADPVASPEHILLATIIEKFWREGRDLDLATLVGQVPKPPLRKLGVFDVDTFFPEKDRMALAMKLNGLLASPSFAAWLEGVPLDIEEMLGGGGKTKAAIVYLTHLSDAERQFVVTLLLSKLVTWFRGLSGTADLRALTYMDEVFGFAPPTAEPPSKKPILTILKQARAHGVGMILSTQNPVDLDYKAMANAGTWMVGRLQTENDKRRILEGMESATGTVDVKSYDRLISDLDKRQFVMSSTKTAEPTVFSSRWAMSYLAGPLTREQVSELMGGARVGTEPSAPASVVEVPEPGAPSQPLDPIAADEVPVMPKVAEGVASVFLDPAAPWSDEVGADPSGTRLRAGAVATVNLLYDDTAAGVNHSEVYETVIHPLGMTLAPESVREVDHDPRDFVDAPPERASYVLTEAQIDSNGYWSSLETGLKDHLVARRALVVFKCPELKLYSRPGEGREEFSARAVEAAQEAADQELAKLKDRFETRLGRARTALAKAENRVRDLEADVSSKQQEELLSGAGDLLGALLGGRRRSNPLGGAARRRAASQRARTRADAAYQSVDEEQAELIELEDELAEEIASITDEMQAKAARVEEVEIPLEKTDIRVADLRLLWVPTA
jgi:hypothetical protein